ncbi:MAG: radical SAM protein [bacterium]
MFYLKNSDLAQLFEIVLLENAFDQELPYFAEPELTPATVLHLTNATLQAKDDGHALIWNPETGTWCFISPMEYPVCQSMMEPIRYGELRQKHRLQHGDQDIELTEFLTHLYQRGLLALDGQQGIDQDIYANGPLFTEAFILELMLTEKCNLGCAYCFAEADNSKDDMTLELGKRAIDKMLALPDQSFVVKFGGGEPLSRFRTLIQLVEYALQANKTQRAEEAAILFDITTNGTLITDRVVEALRCYPIRLQISFDGLPEIHDTVRYYLNGKGSSRDVVAAFSELHQNELPFRVITVVRGPHIPKAKDLFRYYDDLGIKHVRFNPMIRSGRGSFVEQQHGITPESYFHFMQQLVEHMAEHLTFSDDSIQSMVRNLVGRTRDFRCMRGTCGAGITYLNVDAKGNLHPCAYFRSASRHVDLGNVESNDLSFHACCKNDPIVTRMAQRTVHTIARCSRCPWRHVCTGGCAMGAYQKYGNFDHPSDLCDYYVKMYPFLLDTLHHTPELATFLLPDIEQCMPAGIPASPANSRKEVIANAQQSV